jgi:hypothetical protein
MNAGNRREWLALQMLPFIGADLYGLSLAAHLLRSKGVWHRIFGDPMQF